MSKAGVLHKLGRGYGTDKVHHGYLAHYDVRFAGLRDQAITLLEIGVMEGASLRMWREYFPLARVHGIDANAATIFQEDGISTYYGREEDAAFLAEVIEQTGALDIVIDDGSHHPRYQMISFPILWRELNPGGWYAIEDCFSFFDICWTQPDDRTILDRLQGEWRKILTGQGDIGEVHIIGGGCNDGLILLRKQGAHSEGENA